MYKRQVFQISQVWVGTPIADLLFAWLETFQKFVGGLLENASPILYALVVDGIIGGVIAVIGFLPLVMVMYFLIAILEDLSLIHIWSTLPSSAVCQTTPASFKMRLTIATYSA